MAGPEGSCGDPPGELTWLSAEMETMDSERRWLWPAPGGRPLVEAEAEAPVGSLTSLLADRAAPCREPADGDLERWPLVWTGPLMEWLARWCRRAGGGARLAGDETVEELLLLLRLRCEPEGVRAIWRRVEEAEGGYGLRCWFCCSWGAGWSCDGVGGCNGCGLGATLAKVMRQRSSSPAKTVCSYQRTDTRMLLAPATEPEEP